MKMHKFTQWACMGGAALLLATSAGPALGQCVQGGVATIPLIAGQNISAGEISLSVDPSKTTLLVTYATGDGWLLTSLHLWVGSDMAELPLNRAGNPAPGQFPYNVTLLAPVTSYTIQIPLSDIGFWCPSDDTDFFMAAHATVKKLNADGITFNSQTAWGAGTRINPQGNWATASTFTLTCTCGSPPPDNDSWGCETAFACSTPETPGTYCFSNWGFDRWGWSNPLEDIVMPFFAGAGQCDLSKGTLVGTVSVAIDGGSATVSIAMEPEFVLKGSNLYIGSEPFPRLKNGKGTVAPGQYPYSSGPLNDSGYDYYNIPVGDGAQYIIVHGDVCRR